MRAKMFGIFMLLAIGSAAGLLLQSADAQARGDRRRLKCESLDGRRHVCPAIIGGDVVITRLIGGSRCRQGRDWGWSSSGIWVDNGCRADFEFTVGRPDERSQVERRRLKCESLDRRRQWCQADVAGNVVITRRIAGSRCREGQDWGWDRRGIWVDNGCRADFEFDALLDRSEENRDREWNATQRAAYNRGYERGEEDRRAGRSADYERYSQEYTGHTEPYFREGYDDGFAARPRDYRFGSSPRPSETWPPASGARRVVCESSGSFVECPLEKPGYVRLLRQLGGSAPCTEGETWGVAISGRAIWVDRGCRGEFEVSPRR